jgi:formamidopyrimidine-DNA glycosylase
MPELPEVETIARQLQQRASGNTVTSVTLHRADVVHGWPMPLCAALRNQKIEQIYRQGKRIRIQFSGDWTLVVHLGMTGRITIANPGQPLEPHTHLCISLSENRREMRFCDPRRFGAVWLIGHDESQDNLRHWIGRKLAAVGSDPLEISLDELAACLGRNRRIKPLLLDQQPISGIGNIYCDEVLHRARLHPLTPARQLGRGDVNRLRRAMRQVLSEAIAAGGSTISDYRTADNQQGNFQQKHRVYNRAGKKCKRCGQTIQRLLVAGRSTFLCTRCQPMQELAASAAGVNRSTGQSAVG